MTSTQAWTIGIAALALIVGPFIAFWASRLGSRDVLEGQRRLIQSQRNQQERLLQSQRDHARQQRDQIIFDKRSDAYVGMIKVLLNLPRNNHQLELADARLFFDQVGIWLNAYNDALAPLYAYSDSRTHTIFFKGRRVVSKIGTTTDYFLKELAAAFAVMESDDSSADEKQLAREAIARDVPHIENAIDQLGQMTNSLLSHLRAELAPGGAGQPE